MKTVRMCLIICVGMLATVASQQVSSAQQQNEGAAADNCELAGFFTTSSGGILSAAQKSVLTQDQDTGDCSNACEPECCDSCKSSSCCCKPKWRFFGDFLYIRPRNAEVAYAVPFDGPVTPPDDIPIQVGRIAMVDPDYTPAFRVGFARDLTPCSSLGATYTQLDSSTSDSISVDAPLVLRSMVVHPSTLTATADWLDAQAEYKINYKLVDLDYRRIFACGECYTASYLIGARYGHLEQDFQSTFSAINTESVNTNIKFDGGGIRLGLEGERRARCSGWLVYGKGSANFVAGEFSGHYFQGSSVDPEIVNTSWKSGRIMSMLELELGVGWASPNGCLRFTGGYMVNAWHNAVKTADFIGAVQHNDFTDMSAKLTFDGLVARAELRY